MIPIEKHIPAPAKPSGRTKYPMSEMEVGDSFLVPGERERQSVTARASCLKPKRFQTAKQPNGTIRVWRVA